jgi:hypothetical protein
MLGLFPYTEICQSLLNTCDLESLSRYNFTLRGMRLALQARAHHCEPSLPVWDTESCVLVASGRIEEHLRELFSREVNSGTFITSQSELTPVSDTERMNKLSRLREALNLLRKLDRNLYEIFNSVISCIFVSNADKAFGGSSSATPSVIWANVPNQWSTWDTLEFLVHELTHNLMFFDEFSALHYRSRDELTRPETFAQSTILKQYVPLNKALHSIAAGIAILNLRANAVFQQVTLGEPLKLTTGIHPNSVSLVQQLRASVNSIFENRAAMNLLSPRGLELLNKSKARVDEFAGVAVSLLI